jgi:hypothetical protein
VQAVHADAVLVVELHVEIDRLDQPHRIEGGEHGRAELRAVADAAQYVGDMLQVGTLSALRQEHRLAFAETDARMFQVNVDHRLPAQFVVDALFLEADQERPLGDSAWQVRGVPAVVLQEQVFVLLEPQQRHRLPFAAVAVLAEKDRVFPLQLGVFARERQHHADVVGEFAAEAHDHAQVLVGHVVEQFVSGHLGSSDSTWATATIAEEQCAGK